MKIEVLYFAGCPNHLPTSKMVREVVLESGAQAEIVEVEVRSAEQAEEMGFLGSPSVRVKGLDVERNARMATAYGLVCRTYLSGGRRSGKVPAEMVRDSIAEEISRARTDAAVGFDDSKTNTQALRTAKADVGDASTAKAAQK